MATVTVTKVWLSRVTRARVARRRHRHRHRDDHRRRPVASHERQPAYVPADQGLAEARARQGLDRRPRRVRGAARRTIRSRDRIIVGYEPANDVYFYTDRDRRTTLFVRGALFAVAVIALGRWRGVTALIALGASVAVLLQFIVPSVLDGRSPLLVAIVGSSALPSSRRTCRRDSTR